MNQMNEMNQYGMIYNPGMMAGTSVNSGQSYYFNQSGNTTRPNHPGAPINVDNILFVADLPDETCEEDLSNFFKGRGFCLAKIFK